MSILNTFRHVNPYLLFVIILVGLIPLVYLVREQIIKNDENKQDFENRLLATIAANQKATLQNDIIKNHNSGVIVHNQEILVHNQQVLLKRGSFDVLGGIRNDTRTDFLPIGNETVDPELLPTLSQQQESFNSLISNGSKDIGKISSGGLHGPVVMNDSEIAALLSK